MPSNSQELIHTIELLLESPALNLDDLEPQDRLCIAIAQKVLLRARDQFGQRVQVSLPDSDVVEMYITEAIDAVEKELGKPVDLSFLQG